MGQNVGCWIVVVILAIGVLATLNREGIDRRCLRYRHRDPSYKQAKSHHFGQSSHTAYDTRVLTQ